MGGAIKQENWGLPFPCSAYTKDAGIANIMDNNAGQDYYFDSENYIAYHRNSSLN